MVEVFNTSLQWCEIAHITEIYAVKHVQNV